MRFRRANAIQRKIDELDHTLDRIKQLKQPSWVLVKSIQHERKLLCDLLNESRSTRAGAQDNSGETPPEQRQLTPER